MRLQGRKREREGEGSIDPHSRVYRKYEIRDGTSFDRRIQLVQFENGAFPLGIIIRTAVGSRLISRTSGFPYSLWDILEGLSNRVSISLDPFDRVAFEGSRDGEKKKKKRHSDLVRCHLKSFHDTSEVMSRRRVGK